MKTYLIVLFIIIIMAIVVVQYRETIKINSMVFLIIKRGILAPDCWWWGVSEALLKDASGVDYYYTLKEKYGQIAPVNFFGTKLYLLMDVNYIKQLLDNSPFIFGVGKLKYDMFKSFMSKNVGVSEGCEWVRRRSLNDIVLETDQTHHNEDVYRCYMRRLLKNNLPRDYSEFSQISKQLSYYAVFGDNLPEGDNIFKIFSQANSIYAIWTGNVTISPKVMENYTDTLNKYINSPKANSLVKIAVENYCPYITREALVDQIPHWMFPIVGLISMSFPRLLALLCNSPENFKELIECIKVDDKIFLRKCILETLRLNNPVVTTFRTLLKDYCFEPGVCFDEGTQFVILNNPVLRSPEFFEYPNEFRPERWTPELERSYYSIMFNQGPQRCPGKELAINILQNFVIEYLEISGIMDGREIDCNIKIDVENVPQMISPCNIKFK